MKKQKKAAVLIFLSCAFFLHAAPNTWYVDLNSPQDGPGDTPETAWRVIQDAVDHVDVQAGDTILVAPGVYDQGGHQHTTTYWEGYSRVFIHKAVSVIALSTNPSDTIIAGAPDPGAADGRGPNSHRGVRTVSGAALIGFTVTNGYGDSQLYGTYGSGVYLAGADAVVSNCVFTGNGSGSGVIGVRGAGGAVYNCVLTGDYASIGINAFSAANNLRVFNSTIKNFGTGVRYAIAVNCEIRDNASRGAFISFIINCLIAGNGHINKPNETAGMWGGTAINSTIVSNYSGHGAYGSVGREAVLRNCIVWGNYLGTTHNMNNIKGDGSLGTTNVQYTCFGTNWSHVYPSSGLTLAQAGEGCFVENPVFIAEFEGDYRVDRRLSPCIKAGNNTFIEDAINDYPEAAFDLDGNPRISQGVVDLGAYEYNPPPPGLLLRFF